MIKNLLSLALLSSMAIGANAYNVDDFIYTRAAKYKVTAANLVTNGELKGASLDGWTATDPTAAGLAEVFTVLEDGGVKVNSGMTALENGMYQVINVANGGTYVVTMKVKGAEEGYTDLDQTAPATNYIFAYFNTDGTLSTVGGNKNTTLSFGEGGAAIEACYSFTADDYTEMAFTVEAPSEGKIVIDLRGMVADLEIKDIECHAVTSVIDERIAQARLNYIKYIINGFEWTSEYDYFDDVKADITALENAIKTNSADINTYLDNLNGDFKSFAEANLANVFEAIPTTDGSSNAENNSANWMNWTAKWNSLGYSERNGQYTGKAPWNWSTDRWSHKTAAKNMPMQIQWMRKASGDWDNIATLTCTLDKGTYFYSVDGQGGMMTLNKERWARHSGYECASTQIFFGVDGAATANDTLDCGMLPTQNYKSYINKYVLAEDSKVNLGIRCNQTLDVLNGFDVFFANPMLYKVLVKGELTPNQKTYLSLVETQIAKLEERIKEAEELVAATQTEKPWGKENLQKGIDAAKARLEVMKKYNQEEILEAMANETASFNVEGGMFYVDGEYITKDSVYTNTALCDVFEAAGSNYLKNEFVDVFNALNTPLTDMPAAIEAAKVAKTQRIFSSSSKMGELGNEITKVENLYKEKLAAAYSAENAQALVDAKAALAQLVEEFKAAIKAEVLVDIDFENTSFVKHEDPEGEVDTYFTLAGKTGEMKFTSIAEDNALGTNLYELGYRSDAEAELAYPGILRVGDTSATVDFNAAPVNKDEIVRVSFDYYFGNLTGGYAGYYLTAGQDTICGLFCDMYNSKDTYNTLGVDYGGKLTKVGSGAAQNDAIAAESNKSHFEVVLDYGNKVMYCTTTSSKGAATTAEVALNPEQKITGFRLVSNYAKTNRRCWFDNLKIESITVGATTGINDVATVAKAVKVVKAIENGQLVIKTANGTFNAVGVQIK